MTEQEPVWTPPRLREDDEPAPTRARPSRLPDSLLRHVDRATILALAGDPESASRAALDGAATANRSGVTGPWAAVLAAVRGDAPGGLFVLAGGSNVVVADGGFPGTVLLLRTRGMTAASDGDRVRLTVAAG